MTHKEDGFTLLEMLVVLSIWSVFILFMIPIDLDLLEKQQEEQFLKTFSFDVLYVQSLATVTTDYVRIKFHKDGYAIHVGNIEEKSIERKVPKGWSIDYRVLSRISFDGKGRMRTPGNLIIKAKHGTYRVVFPFGKGRFYVIKQ